MILYKVKLSNDVELWVVANSFSAAEELSLEGYNKGFIRVLTIERISSHVKLQEKKKEE